MQLSRRSIVKSRNARASVSWHGVVSLQSESSDAGGCSYGLNSHVELWCANDIGNSLSSDNDFACRFLEARSSSVSVRCSRKIRHFRELLWNLTGEALQEGDDVRYVGRTQIATQLQLAHDAYGITEFGH